MKQKTTVRTAVVNLKVKTAVNFKNVFMAVICIRKIKETQMKLRVYIALK